MTAKQKYLRALMQQSAKWILSSARQPNQWMTPMHVKLHYLALRKRGVNCADTNTIGIQPARAGFFARVRRDYVVKA